MDLGGYAGKILFVDLTRAKIWSEDLLPGQTRDFIGGSGLNYSLARELIVLRSDPLAPDNPVIIGVHPGLFTPEKPR